MPARNDRLPRDGEWTGARVGVLGLGRSGVAAAELLLNEGARVFLLDDDEAGQSRPQIAALLPRVAAAQFGSEAHGLALVAQLDALVLSPGVSPRHPVVRAADAAQLPVLSELELAARRMAAPMILVTGTNGKSTTVSLIDALLGAADRRRVLAGNIGTAAASVARALTPDAVAVIEASSFQLERVSSLHPRVAVLLNIAPDHLDRYDALEDYAAAKRNMLMNLDQGDAFVFPRGDANGEAWSAVCSSRPLRFSAAPIAAVEDGTGLEDGWLVQSYDGRKQRVLPVAELPLLGSHNVLNALASLAALLPFDLPVEALAEGLRGFRGLAHRVEAVGRLDGVFYVDDSKATNVHAAQTALAGLEGPIVLLLGGHGKNEDYRPLREAMARVKSAICYGAEGERLARALQGAVSVERASGMLTALARARELATAGDTVLLSPACASFDEFSNFNERGEVFAAWVAERGGEAS